MTDYEKLKNVFDELGIKYYTEVYTDTINIILGSWVEDIHFQFFKEDESIYKVNQK
jgi:hypothetical protein